jgi:hypothetical protein
MATDKKPDVTKWNSADEATLVATLIAQKNQGNWGDNNPKPSVYTQCVAALAGSEKISGGCAKGVTAVKSRWNRVCLAYFHSFEPTGMTKCVVVEARV